MEAAQAEANRRLEAAQEEMAKQIAELAKTVHLAIHGPTDQPPDKPTGFLPRLLILEQHYRETKTQKVGFWERMQAGVIAGAVSLLIHVVTNLDNYKGANQP
jgi:hypothetical protein